MQSRSHCAMAGTGQPRQRRGQACASPPRTRQPRRHRGCARVGSAHTSASPPGAASTPKPSSTKTSPSQQDCARRVKALRFAPIRAGRCAALTRRSRGQLSGAGHEAKDRAEWKRAKRAPDVDHTAPRGQGAGGQAHASAWRVQCSPLRAVLRTPPCAAPRFPRQRDGLPTCAPPKAV